MADEFNPNAIDGDGDGLVQDGTKWQRPVEDAAVMPDVEPEPESEPAVEEAPEAESDGLISSPEPVASAEPALAPVADGVIGSGTKKKTVKKPAARRGDTSPKPEMVAVYSTRNVSWPGVGRVNVGLNIVTKEAAEQWLTRDHIRKAEPTEVAKEL